MKQRSPTLAIAVSILLAFAMGMSLNTIFGIETARPFADQTTCGPEDVACATALSARATATIAWWTAVDALLSVGAGLAAIFAFKAYRQAKRQADAAESHPRCIRCREPRHSRRDGRSGKNWQIWRIPRHRA